MFVDTSVLVEIARRTEADPVARALRAALATEPLFLSAIQLGELADYYGKVGVPFEAQLEQIRGSCEIVPVDAETAVEGSSIKAAARREPMGRDFSLIDGVILASARRRRQRLLTLAREFSMFSEVEVFPMPAGAAPR